MKVLFCHNSYRYRGGEDQSFESEVEMLRDNGVEVITFCRHNSDMDDTLGSQARTVARAIYSRSARRTIDSLIRQHQPDLLHCNNLFPQISTSIYGPAHRRGIPIVQAIRNYRVFCANAFFYRDGHVCTDCLNRVAAFPSIRHGCYRDSRAASAAVTTMQLVQRTADRIRKPVSIYFTPSEFARQTMISGGFDPETICVKPNFIYPDPGVGHGDPCRSDFRPNQTDHKPVTPFVFIGRLSREKGLATLVDAWKQLNAPLSIIGDGPLREEIAAFANRHPTVTFHGELEHDELIRMLGQARGLIMPSLWFETFGRTIAEAFSQGTPVIASRLGAMAELVDDGFNGYLFQPGNAHELACSVKRLVGLPDQEYRSLCGGARKSFEDRFTRESNFQRLMEIYDIAFQSRSGEKRFVGVKP